MDECLGLQTSSGEQIAFSGAKLTAHLAGLLAQTRLEQHYVNSTADNLEITYTFALPVDAVLLGFEVELGDRKWVGQVVPRAEAEEQYEDAVEAGNSAFRLTLLSSGLYAAALGNLMPGETVVLWLRYAEPLRRVSGRLRYRLPTTIAPRYGEPNSIPAWLQPHTDLKVAYLFDATVHLHGELSKARFVCPTHRLACEFAAGCLTLTLVGAQMDRDFVLDLEPQGTEAMGVSALSGKAEAAVIAMASFIPPPRKISDDRRELVILLDCSGSMAGDSIAHAKEGVLLALASMNPEDHFGLIRFGSEAQPFAPRILQADRETLQRAEQWVHHTDATMGGTELLAALNQAMTLPGSMPQCSGRDILLLTDGEVWDLGDFAVNAWESNARIFTVGIGAAVAEETVRRLADKTGGACEMVTPDEAMPARIAAHFARMRQLSIRSVDIDWGLTPSWEVRPQHALFAGDAFVVYAAFPSPVETVSTVLRYADGVEQVMSIPLTPVDELSDAVIRCAAASHLKTLPTALRADWAVKYQLVSEQTDYIVILERASGEQAETLPVLQQIPNMLPAGWGGTGTVRSGSTGLASYCMDSFDDSDIPTIPAVLRNVRHIVIETVAPTVSGAISNTVSAMVSAAQPLDAVDTALLNRVAVHCGDDPSKLPLSIDELITFGLDPAMIDVLKDLVTTQRCQESEVVRAYLVTLAREAAPGTVEAYLLVHLNKCPLAKALLDAVDQAAVKAKGLQGSMRQASRTARRMMRDGPRALFRRSE